MNYYEFTKVAELVARHADTGVRKGQCYWNTLDKLRPDLTPQLRGGLLDPFYDDGRLPEFLAEVQRIWGTPKVKLHPIFVTLNLLPVQRDYKLEAKHLYALTQLVERYGDAVGRITVFRGIGDTIHEGKDTCQVSIRATNYSGDEKADCLTMQSELQKALLVHLAAAPLLPSINTRDHSKPDA